MTVEAQPQGTPIDEATTMSTEDLNTTTTAQEGLGLVETPKDEEGEAQTETNGKRKKSRYGEIRVARLVTKDDLVSGNTILKLLENPPCEQISDAETWIDEGCNRPADEEGVHLKGNDTYVILRVVKAVKAKETRQVSFSEVEI